MSGRAQGSAPPPSPDEVTAAARSALGPGEAGWLVGGCLRDELLGVPVRDVDIVVDGAAEPFSQEPWRTGSAPPSSPPRTPSAPGGSCSATCTSTSPRCASRAAAPAAGPPDPAHAQRPAGGRPARPRLHRRRPGPAARRRRARRSAERPRRPRRAPAAALLVLGARRRPAAGRPSRPSGARASTSCPTRPPRRRRCRAAAGLVGRERRAPARRALGGRWPPASAAAAFRDLAVWGALAVVLPELDGLRGVEQNPYHHLDVFEHTLEALTYVRRRGRAARRRGAPDLARRCRPAGVAPLVPVSWAVLLHDIGKPAAAQGRRGGPRALLAPRRDRPRRWPPPSPPASG